LFQEFSSADADVLNGVDYVLVNFPAAIFNYSSGHSTLADDEPFVQEIDYLADVFGLSFIVSAGNDGPGQSVNAPGIGYNILSVAAMNTNDTPSRLDDTIAQFSSRGPTIFGRFKPDVAAPGGETDALNLQGGGITSANAFFTSPSSVEVKKPGTSMAAPHITGAVALLAQAGIANPLAAKALLINTTDFLNWAPDEGFGYANLARTKQQLGNVVAGSLNVGGVQYNRTNSSGLTYATLAWNRHVNYNAGIWSLNNLDLYAYNQADGSLLAASNSIIQNVEKLSFTLTGPSVLKVKFVPLVEQHHSQSKLTVLRRPSR
jgi:serine protease AprX